MADSSCKSPKKEVQCYVHAVSPVKTATSNNRKYFNCTIQSEEKVTRAVCFSPDKHSQLKTLQQTKSPIKIENFGHARNDENGDMLIHKFTKIVPIDATTISFPYSDNLTASGIIPISSIANLAVEQLVSVKAEVAHLSGVKILQTQHQGTLKKQEVIIRDTTSSIKLTLWGNNVDTLALNDTYILKNLQVKSFNDTKFLNTAKGEECVHEESTPFEQACVSIDNITDFAEKTIFAKVLGIHQVTRSLSCVSCNKKVVPNPDDDSLGACESCYLKQLTETCNVKWYLRILVQPLTEPNRKLHLTLFNQHVTELLALVNTDVDPDKASPNEIESAFLRATGNITFTFDTMDHKVIAVE
ncbi:Hypothetical predicted protein [Paramuricea clavata]|uniref:Uncharacterized protein n=1 Tax=Paramuricea clavata TaxID=317549 RepID=A0A6S7J1U0_PARCT|nr:Hypothetical predicted protein [Paramuricea clavata]